METQKAEWPKHGLSYIEISKSPFTSKGRESKSIIVNKNGNGLKLVTLKQWYKSEVK